jgi:hypothetical protein
LFFTFLFCTARSLNNGQQIKVHVDVRTLIVDQGVPKDPSGALRDGRCTCGHLLVELFQQELDDGPGQVVIIRYDICVDADGDGGSIEDWARMVVDVDDDVRLASPLEGRDGLFRVQFGLLHEGTAG